MLSFIFNIWYRKQNIIDNYKLFKYALTLFGAIILFIFVGVVNVIGSAEGICNRFILFNLLSMIFTLYNLPTIVNEIKDKKALAIIQMRHGHYFWLFTYTKENALIIPYFLGIIFSFGWFLVTEPINCLIILSAVPVQFSVILINFVSNKLKLYYLSCIVSIFPAFYFVNYLMIFLTAAITIISIIVGLPGIIRGQYFDKKFKNKFCCNIKNNYAGYLVKYLLRIKKREYVDILFTLACAVISYQLSGSIKIVEFYFILFFLAKIQLQIETKQSNYNRIYLRNMFYEARDVKFNSKMLHSSEFKILVLDIMAILIFFAFAFFYYGISMIYFFNMINMILLMFFYMVKILQVFYIKLNKKDFFKGTFVNLFLFYLVFFIINSDYLIKGTWYYPVRLVITIFFLKVPLEKILVLNLFGEKAKCEILK